MAFAKDFVWGAASSAYQTEGSPRADGGGESIWDVFCRRPGAVADGFDGSAATDAYRRYEEDIACAAQMGLGAYRFSVSWARVDPYGDGRWNGEGFAFYLRMLQACRAAGLEPYVTLYHWELPQALEDGRLAQPRDRPCFCPLCSPRRRAVSAALQRITLRSTSRSVL
ncbi:MAG: family 1 glycosylhydrolase [Ruthenibacterium lactatiformans]